MIAAIESAMIARLRAASDADLFAYRLRSVASYGGEFAGGLRRVIAQFPAAWVVFNGEDPVDKVAPDAWRMAGRFAVIVGARHLSSEQAGRHGRGGEPGAYQLIHDVRRTLFGRDLGLDEVEPLELGPVRPLFNDTDEGDFASIYAVEFRTRYVVGEAADPLPDFERSAHGWDMADPNRLGDTSGPDGQIDAEDRIAFPDTGP